jgi:hypothetical protein
MPSATPTFTAGLMIAVIRVFNSTGDEVETHAHKGDFKEP